VKLRLTDADRERLGGPEWLDGAVNPLRVREAEALEDATKLSTAAALEAMEPTLEPMPGGQKIRYHYSARGIRLRVWLGLFRAGVETSYADLDFDAQFLLIHHEAEPPQPEGKDDGSPSAEPSTKSTSPSTGRTRSRKSAAST
jgi:hypothetical protein